MQKLNQQATRIFCLLLHRLNGKEHMQLTSDGFMPLTMECIEENISTPLGMGKLYSLCHYYEQNGDLMRDPEMCFIAVDKRTDAKDYTAVGIYPQMYRLDSLGIEEESIRIENGRLPTYIKLWQQGHCQFANQWMKNIIQQGFLDKQR